MTHRQRFLAGQDGFTLVAVTITMMVLSLFAVSAWATANNAFPGMSKDSDSKRAYEAAEAGIQWYQFQVQRDTNYWTKCADPANAIYLRGGRPATSASSGWHALPSSQEAFAIELVGSGTGATDDTACEKDPGTALLGTDGILTVRSTGRYHGKVRQIVAKFRRAGFIDYIWYTKWETAPPPSYGNATDVTWVQNNCDITRAKRPHGGSTKKDGSGLPSSWNGTKYTAGCSEITFRGTDTIAGPLHTEDDSVSVCGTPTFGDLTGDKIEIKGGTTTSWYQQYPGCSGTVTPKGTLVAPAKSLELPKNNLQLASQATYTFKGSTCLQFSGASVTVYTNQTWGNGVLTCSGTTQTLNLGPNTVIWIANNGSCADSYDYLQNYTNKNTCGDVAVQGTYSTNVTIGAEDDVIVTADLVHQVNSDAMLGLVANQFVRVYHPVTPTTRTANQSGCSNNGGAKVNNIDAAILATQGSFLTDNWDCGAGLGNLNVNGAITQYWRGAVGTTDGHGYTKAYKYDRRLRYREPPNFLDPTTALWGVLRQSEQSPVLSN